jgi:hypothetical protein
MPAAPAPDPTQLDQWLHDLKQPLNLVRVVAQDVRLDARKGRLDPATLPERMLEIERAVDDAVARLAAIRALLNPVQ